MGIFSKLFGHKNDDKKVGGMEDYMTLGPCILPGCIGF